MRIAGLRGVHYYCVRTLVCFGPQRTSRQKS
jgi:hypothetical protein